MSWAQRDGNEQSRLTVDVLSGSDFATITTLGIVQGSELQGWQQAVLDVKAFRGQTIKLRFQSDDVWDRQGHARIDNLSLQTEVPDWQPSDSNVIHIVEDSSSIAGPYLLISSANQSVLSSAFTVLTETQSLRFDYMSWAQRDPNELSRLFVDVVNEANFATSTPLAVLEGSQGQGWKQAILDMTAFHGQTVKLRFRSDDYGERQPRVRIDTISLNTEIPGWQPSDAQFAHIMNDSNSIDGPYLQINATNQAVTSSPFKVGTSASLQFQYMSWAQRDSNERSRLYVEVLTGQNRDIYTLLSVLEGSQNQGWQAAALDLQAFQGQVIQLRFRSDDWRERQGRVRLDSLTINAGGDIHPPGLTSPTEPVIALNQVNSWVTSDAFIVPQGTQSLQFDYKSWARRNATEESRIYVEVFNGADFGVTTLIGTVQGSYVQGWKHASLDLSAFRERTIKLRFRSDDWWDRQGQAQIGKVSYTSGASTMPTGWDYHMDNYLSLDGPNQWALSSPFTVISPTMYVDYTVWARRNATEQTRLFVEVLNGSEYATTTLLTTLQGAAIDGWREHQELNLQAFQGQSIKLRFRVDDWWDRQAQARVGRVTATIQPSAPSSSACTLQTLDWSDKFITTPNEPYILRMAQDYSNAIVMVTYSDKEAYLDATGDALGGIPRNIQVRLRLIHHPTLPQKNDPVYIEICTLGQWQDLISFRPLADIQYKAQAKSMLPNNPAYIHKIESAWGDINLDRYPVIIKDMPFKSANPVDPFDTTTLTTTRYTSVELLELIRTNIDRFVDTNISSFRIYSTVYPNLPGADDTIWLGSNPRGSVVSISLRIPELRGVQADLGSVITSEYSSQYNHPYWRFTTVNTPGDGSHPVSGTREFGLEPGGIGNPNTWVFYTRAADRATLINDRINPVVFPIGDRLWRSLQLRVSDFVTNRGGIIQANALPTDSVRYPWSAVCLSAWQPTTAWVNTAMTDPKQCYR